MHAKEQPNRRIVQVCRTRPACGWPLGEQVGASVAPFPEASEDRETEVDRLIGSTISSLISDAFHIRYLRTTCSQGRHAFQSVLLFPYHRVLIRRLRAFAMVHMHVAAIQADTMVPPSAKNTKFKCFLQGCCSAQCPLPADSSYDE